MARKVIGYVQLEWTCPRCETKNPGPNQFCNACGAPQPEDVEFHQPAQEVLVKDEAEIARAKAGPDVHCPYCEARNPGTAKFCGACGGDLTKAAVRETGRVIGAHRAEPAQALTCPACNTHNPASAQRCLNCGASLVLEKPEVPTPKPKAKVVPRRQFALSGIGIVALFICIAVIAVAIMLGLRTEETIGEVSSVNWTHMIPILELGPVEHEGWFDDIPSDTEIGTCRLEFHHTQEDPAPNAQEVCGTPYTVDTGSGYGEVVQDCVYEVYEDWCTYTQMEWISVDTVTVSGNDLDPYWPSPSLSEGQMEGEGEVTYEVIFQTSEGTYPYTTTDLGDFQQFEIGSRWALTLNAFNSIVSVEPSK